MSDHLDKLFPYKNNDAGAESIAQVEFLISPVVRRRDDADESGVDKSYSNEGSNQLEPQVTGIYGATSGYDEVIPPPIDLRLWAAQLSRNTRLNRGIRVIARNTVGLGWEIVPAKPVTRDTTPEELEAIRVEALRVEAYFEDVNKFEPLENLLECAVIDEEATGNGYLEYTRTATGELDKIFHIASPTMRILKEGRGFMQQRDGRRKFFKHLGDERLMNSDTGRFSDEEGFLGEDTKQNEEGALPASKRATEIMHFRLYHPSVECYGLPRYVSAGAAISGNFHAAKRNVAFFVNDAVPRMAVLVSGGSLTKESTEEIKKMFQEGQGADQAHRVMILQTQNEGVGVDEKSRVTLELERLAMETTEDGSFQNYRRMNDEEIRESLGLSEVFFKSEKLTKASAVVAKATTDEQEFKPARLLKEKLINKRVVRDGLGARLVKFQLKAPETSDPKERAEVHKIYSDISAITANEIRHEIGKDPLPPEEQWANLPLPIALPGVLGQIAEGSTFAAGTGPVEDGQGTPDEEEGATPPANGSPPTPAPAATPAPTTAPAAAEGNKEAFSTIFEKATSSAATVLKDFNPSALRLQPEAI